MNDIGVGTEKQNKFSELIGRVKEIAVLINASSNSLDSITDSLIGALPEVAGDSDKAPCREGKIGELEDMIDTLTMRSAQINDSVNRLVKSGIV